MALVAGCVIPGTNVESISTENIRFIYIMTLPFRLGIGEFRRIVSGYPDKRIDIFAYNKIPLPPKDDIDDCLVHSVPESTDGLRSRVAIVVGATPGDDTDLHGIHTWLENRESVPPMAYSPLFLGVQSLNRYIVSLTTIVRNHLANVGRLHMLHHTDYLDAVEQCIVVVCPSDFSLTSEMANGILAAPGHGQLRKTMWAFAGMRIRR